MHTLICIYTYAFICTYVFIHINIHQNQVKRLPGHYFQKIQYIPIPQSRPPVGPLRYIYVHVYKCLYIYIYIYIYICIYVYMYTYIYLYVYRVVQLMSPHTPPPNTYIYIFVCTYIYVCLCIYIYI
jgi:hypothetical protein